MSKIDFYRGNCLSVALSIAGRHNLFIDIGRRAPGWTLYGDQQIRSRGPRHIFQAYRIPRASVVHRHVDVMVEFPYPWGLHFRVRDWLDGRRHTAG